LTLSKILFSFLQDLKSAITDLSVIVGIIIIYQFAILQSVPDNLPAMMVGLMLVAIGLALFLRGLEVGIFPLGEDLSQQLAKMSNRCWIVIFAFVIGFATTIAEPALIAIAAKAEVISQGEIDALTLRLVVAFSVGLAIVIGVVRIIINHPIHWYIIAGYLLVVGITFFSPEEIVGLAYDSGGITTSTVTVPLIAALGIGLTGSLKDRNPLVDGFGLIAFASVMPMIFVQAYGILAYYSKGEVHDAEIMMVTALPQDTGWWLYVEIFFASVRDVLPVIIVILFFYYIVLRRKIENFTTRSLGFCLVVLGLYAFVIGLEMGLFPVGESLAIELAKSNHLGLIFSFAFLIGFATTVAEPALTAIARKAEEISDGSINQGYLRMFVAVGVGIGILLGSYRIIHGDSIVYYIMSGYFVVIVMTYFAPRTIIPIAYDSGGVTTSTITVPIVAALGLGLATTIPDRNPLVDGFGLIAFASLFPIIAVLGYGISQREKIRYHERLILKLEQETMGNLGRHISEGEVLSGTFIERRTLPKKKIITITGKTGSGVSTVTDLLSDSLSFRKFSAGGIFRTLANQHKMSVSELNEYSSKNKIVDEEIDALIRRIGEGSETVLDARLGYYWIHDSFRVFLDVDDHVAAERIYQQISGGSRSENGATSLEQTKNNIALQAKDTRDRLFRDYGIDISNTNMFDLIINTGEIPPEDIARQIKEAFRAWLKSN
jgi:cytidylate kinase